MAILNSNGMPGIQASISSAEAQVWYGHENLKILAQDATIGAAAIDAGNSPTSQLRPGLVMAKKDADGFWYEYDATQTDGREVARGVLVRGVGMLNVTSGAAENKVGPEIMIGGQLKAAALNGLDATARLQMVNFTFDDQLPSISRFNDGFLREVSKAANYTVLASDNVTEFVATAAVVFTLPAIQKGLRFKFRQQANASLHVAAASAVLVGLNSATLNSVTFNTAGQMLGAAVTIRSNDAGTKWIAESACPPGVFTATWA